jgi:hypothetical protein
VIRRLVMLGVVVALLGGADLAARGFVSATVENRAQQEAPQGSTVSADVGGFPFVPPLLLGGNVSHASVHVANLQASALVFSRIDIDLSGVHLDRGRLINDRKARITKIDHGKVTAVITATALSDALHGVPVEMTAGKLTIAGVNITPSVRNRRLSVGGFTIPLTDYMPCVSAVAIDNNQMELSCEINDVPPALLDAVQNKVDD